MEYRTLKLCSIRTGGIPQILPAGVVVEVEDEDNAKALLELGAIEPVEAPVPDDEDNAAGVGDLDGDSFAAWLASGAKVGQVVDWIGEDVDRAEIAMADSRQTVQKRIEALLEAGDGDEGDGDGDGDDA